MTTSTADTANTTASTTGRYRRLLTAGCLVSTALLSALSVALQPDFGDTTEQRLALTDDAGRAAAVSVGAFVLAQLPFLGAVLGLGHLLRDRAPRLANVAPTVAVIGGFGHAVFGGAMLLTVTMADLPGTRAPYVEALERFESSPAMVFAAMGLLGTVLGILLIAAGLWRAKVGPRWVAPALVAFVVVEFAGTALTTWASPVSTTLYVVAFVALAATVRSTSDRDWEAGTVRPMMHTDS